MLDYGHNQVEEHWSQNLPSRMAGLDGKTDGSDGFVSLSMVVVEEKQYYVMYQTDVLQGLNCLSV